ncbi:MAG TPA: polysaccharide deacetylase family protein [Clostridia bacterium]|nr:polysaccharide deacetylase family protein [Clostridia bacterium]
MAETFRGLLFLLLLSVCASAQSGPRTVAVTVDDIPIGGRKNPATAKEIQNINRRIVEALKKRKVLAVGFVNAGRFLDVPGMEPKIARSVLGEWLRQGMTLGNHTHSHPNLNEITVEEYTKDIVRGEALLNEVMAPTGRKLRHFRYPYNFLGPTEEKKRQVQEFLAGRGYQIATCTVYNADWVFADVYADDLSRNDPASARQVLEAYLQFTAEMFDYHEQRSRELFGREIPLVFLVHANQLNADAMERLLDLIARRGYRFETLDRVQADPAYATPDTYVGTSGPMWQERWASSLGKESKVNKDPDPPKWVLDAYRKVSRRP